MTRVRPIALASTILLPLVLSACGGPAVEDLNVPDDSTPVASETPASLSGDATVGDYVYNGCSTSVVRGLSVQLVTELDCIKPGAVEEIPADSQLDVGGIFDYLQTKPASTLPHVLGLRPSSTMRMHSALRSLAQQYLLYNWYLQGRCGISLAAHPGSSNHEKGLAVDIDDHSAWRSSMASYSWHWFGSSDPVHFDYQGSGTTSITGTSVLAFQRLWNLNNPDDTISEDGVYGPQTAARLKKTPAMGFAQGSTCGASPFVGYAFTEPDDAPERCAL